jgi:ethanolamine utilization protein EutP (predicted NTPase)
MEEKKVVKTIFVKESGVAKTTLVVSLKDAHMKKRKIYNLTILF